MQGLYRWPQLLWLHQGLGPHITEDTLFWLSFTSYSYNLSVPCATVIPEWALRRRVWCRCTMCGWMYTDTNLLYFHELWVPVLVTIHCIEKLLWLDLRAALICRQRDTNLEGDLMYLFSNIAGVGSSLCVACELLNQIRRLIQACISTCGVDLKSD